METTKGNTFKSKTKTMTQNLDLFLYVNSKFVHIEKHTRMQMEYLYRDIITQKCRLEQQVLWNALSLAKQKPHEFAYTLMEGPGYMAITAGEIIHIIKCIPVEIEFRPSEACYNELPVTFRNHSMFLTPNPRILINTGSRRPCNTILLVIYNLYNTWYSVNPTLVEVKAPRVIKPMTTLLWKYVNPEFIATSGIYGRKELDEYRYQSLFAAEKQNLLDNIAHRADGHQINKNDVTMFNLMDQNTLDKIAESTGKRLWDGLITFGTVGAAIYAISVVFTLTKYVLDTTIHGHALHSAYGCSTHILGAIWGALATLLLHRNASQAHCSHCNHQHNEARKENNKETFFHFFWFNCFEDLFDNRDSFHPNT